MWNAEKTYLMAMLVLAIEVKVSGEILLRDFDGLAVCRNCRIVVKTYRFVMKIQNERCLKKFMIINVKSYFLNK